MWGFRIPGWEEKMDKKAKSKMNRWAWPLGLGVAWLIFLLVLAIWSVQSERAHVTSMAEREAKAFFQQMVVTRSWNAAHGGVYVVATPDNPPNPYFKREDRSLETMQGITLTKVNPAYMTRQLSTIARYEHDVQFHITSLDPVRPANKADEWESVALREFERGGKEKFSLVETGGKHFFRYMAPLLAEKGCMRCHDEYGHKGKRLLGGISVTFLADPLINARKSSVAHTHLVFSLIFLVGFIGICGSTYLVQTKRAEAEQANRTKSVFLANMSHDMRTPLNGIMGLTELMQKKGLSQTQSRYADMVRHSAWTLLEIITDITDFSRLESGRLELTKTVFEMKQLLDDALAIFRFESENKGLVLSATVSPDVHRLLKGDAFRLKQVITNLVGNAVKFTEHGIVAVRVSSGGEVFEVNGGRSRNVRVLVEVSDSGIGIPQERQQDIFESFRQVDDSYAKHHEGSGLGLAICRQLVTMMGGSISVRSVLGEGATFSFDVILEVPEKGEFSAEVSDAETAVISAVRPRRVLMAEDNSLNQTFAVEILEEAGHPVSVAANGYEVLELLRNNEFDIVFMDIQMPEMDGLEATRCIRAGEAGEHAKRVPIVAATAFALPGDRQACLDAGMNGFVLKPLTSEDLLQAVVKYTGIAGKTGKAIAESMKRTTKKVKPVLDMAGALERLGGRKGLFKKLVCAFQDDAPSKLADLSDAVRDGRIQDVLRLAHGIKNSAGMIEATALSNAAFALEMAAREDRLMEIPELHDILGRAAEDVLFALHQIVEDM